MAPTRVKNALSEVRLAWNRLKYLFIYRLSRYLGERTMLLRKLLPEGRSGLLKGKRFHFRRGSSDRWVAREENEPQTRDLLGKTRGRVFLDVGAHIGTYSVTLSDNFRKVVSV